MKREPVKVRDDEEPVPYVRAQQEMSLLHDITFLICVCSLFACLDPNDLTIHDILLRPSLLSQTCIHLRALPAAMATPRSGPGSIGWFNAGALENIHQCHTHTHCQLSQPHACQTPQSTPFSPFLLRPFQEPNTLTAKYLFPLVHPTLYSSPYPCSYYLSVIGEENVARRFR